MRLHVSQIVRRLRRANSVDSRFAVAPGGPVVSLTSYGDRVESVHLAIESIAQGSVLPSRMILWLDQEDIYNNPPESLQRLRRRGLEICLTSNYGPHTKYFPFLNHHHSFSRPLVTADDDILYPVDWLSRLVDASNERPDLINCYRARVIAFSGNELAPYEEWRLCTSTHPASHHFATGVSGVIYPPEFLALLKQAGTGFEDCCPKADDIWLHVQALRHRFLIRQIVERSRHFPMIPGSQRIALQDRNRGQIECGNDRQASLTYNQHDLDFMRTLTTN